MANSYLNRTQSSATSDKIGTFSAWIKLSSFSALTDAVFSGHTDSSNRIALYFADTLRIYGAIGGSQSVYLVTNRVFQDPSAFYHVVVAWDTTQGTDSNRFKIYVNGSQITSFSTTSYPSQNADVYWNKGTTSIVGARFVSSVDNYFDGYMSHVSFVDGQQLAPTVFGETDSTSGIWKFKSPSGVTWGNNGFHLKFESSGNLGLDSSGNSNTFTVNGDGKQALDTPTNVSATWNPLASKVIGTVGWALQDGNLSFVPSSNTNQFTTGTLCPAAGKWYYEVKSTQSGGSDWPDIGMMFTDSISAHMAATGNPQHNFSYAAGIEPNGTRWAFGTQTTSWFSGYNSGDIINCAVDIDAGKFWWGVNGSWLNSGNPASGSNPGATFAAGTSITAWTEQYNASNAEVQANFGSGYFGTTAISSAGSNGNGSLFEYDVPSGFYAINTKNINTYG